MKLTFLGTNGWYADKKGNTICALLETPDRYIVLDAGDGIHKLDDYVKDPDKPIDIFLSHFHLDHTVGLHIQPKFRIKNRFTIYGQPGTEKNLDILVAKPFTADMDLLREKLGIDITVHDLEQKETMLGDCKLTALPLVHADPCFGYRFEIDGKVITYCTDTGPCENFNTLAQDADILITECSLLPGEEIPSHWPHMSPDAAAEIAKKSNCKKLFLTHFIPNKYTTLESRDHAQVAARKIFIESYAAKDDMQIEI